LACFYTTYVLFWIERTNSPPSRLKCDPIILVAPFGTILIAAAFWGVFVRRSVLHAAIAVALAVAVPIVVDLVATARTRPFLLEISRTTSEGTLIRAAAQFGAMLLALITVPCVVGLLFSASTRFFSHSQVANVRTAISADLRASDGFVL